MLLTIWGKNYSYCWYYCDLLPTFIIEGNVKFKFQVKKH